jgi:spore coat protein U-like protein
LATLALALAPAAGHAACSSISVTALAFGTYTGALVQNSAATVTATCDSGFAYQIGLGAGTSGNTAARTMTSGGTALNYGMFQDAGYTRNWGNLAGSDAVAAVGTGAAQNVTIFARVPALQYVAPGTYTDVMSAAILGTGLTTTLTVNATVVATCAISAAPLAFGVYFGSQADATTTLSVTCTNTTPFYVNLSAGLNASASAQPRMSGPGGALLAYQMFQDAARSQTWGNNFNVDGEAGAGSGGAQPLTVYGRVPAGQFVTPGGYADTVIATVTY